MSRWGELSAFPCQLGVSANVLIQRLYWAVDECGMLINVIFSADSHRVQFTAVSPSLFTLPCRGLDRVRARCANPALSTRPDFNLA